MKNRLAIVAALLLAGLLALGGTCIVASAFRPDNPACLVIKCEPRCPAVRFQCCFERRAYRPSALANMNDLPAGSSAVEDVLKQNPNPHIRVFAVWEPILPPITPAWHRRLGTFVRPKSCAVLG